MFTNNLTVCIEDSQKSTRNLLKLINELSKFARQMNNTQKSIVLLNTSNEKNHKNTLRKQLHMTIEYKKI